MQSSSQASVDLTVIPPISNLTGDHGKKRNKKKISAYYPSYNADQRPVSDIKYEHYDELVFFVATTNQNFTIGLGDIEQEVWDSRAHEFVHRCKKAGVTPFYCLGGWTGSIYFSSLVSTASNRTEYATSAVNFAKKYGFEGIDIDWECDQGIGCNIVSDADVENYQQDADLLTIELKITILTYHPDTQEIKRIWPEGKLSTAVSIGGIRASDYSPLPASNLTTLIDVVDKLNIMAYDVYGSWSTTTGPLSPLQSTCADDENQISVESAVEVYLQQGFKPSQMALGIPTYGRSWTLASPILTPRTVQNYTTYYYQNFTDIPRGGQFDDEPGVDVCGQNSTSWGGTILFTELLSRGYLDEDEMASAGFVRYYDECSRQPFIVNGTLMISYDDTRSTLRKVQYAKSKNLAGVYFFDTLGTTERSLRAVRQVLNS
ncbi:chitinase [Phakopsora pachyrhizi]|nr:chitinase [Phakopsora pachyrhizi]